ncbi:MAG: hypothetical protein QOE51_4783 [Actinoplanes sp.]|jgi:hypothetical protein|nr:hypothetical protein [Actinoplanes sp.]
MTTDVDSPTGNKDPDSPTATPELRQSTGAHDLDTADEAATAAHDSAATADGSAVTADDSAATAHDSAATADDSAVTADADPVAGTQEEVPFGWEGHVVDDEPETLFRFPAVGDPDPGWQRLLGMSVHAAILGLASVGVGARGLLATLGGSSPGWYIPVLAGTGLLSVALTVAAFLSIHREWLPWMLMLAATVPLGTAVILAVGY